MPIKHSLKAIFIHIPKNGGSSIEEWLFNIDTTGPTRDESSPSILFGVISPQHRQEYQVDIRFREWQHIYAGNLSKLLGKDIWDSYFKFSFVRNPWDRMVSWYAYLHRPEPFSEWVKHCSTSNTYIQDDRILRNQIEWLYDNDGNSLVDFIGRFELLEQDLERIVAELKFTPESPLCHIRKSKRKNYRRYFNRRTRRIVAERYRADIEAFGYEF